MRGGQDCDQFRHNHPSALFRAAVCAAYSCPSNGE